VSTKAILVSPPTPEVLAAIEKARRIKERQGLLALLAADRARTREVLNRVRGAGVLFNPIKGLEKIR
jgi:hypothetical protein